MKKFLLNGGLIVVSLLVASSIYAAATDQSQPSTATSNAGYSTDTINYQGVSTNSDLYADDGASSDDGSSDYTDASSEDTYINVDGNEVESPNDDSVDATAQCNDGTYSHSQHHQGTCSGHDGVDEWLD